MSVRSDAAEPDLARMLAPLDVDPPATEDEVGQLLTTSRRRTARAFPRTISRSSGRRTELDGDLENGAPVVLWKAELLPRINEDSETEEWMPGMFIIGSDAGDAVYGIDMREDAPPERYVETFDVMEWDYVMWRGRSFVDLLSTSTGRRARSVGLIETGRVRTPAARAA